MMILQLENMFENADDWIRTTRDLSMLPTEPVTTLHNLVRVHSHTKSRSFDVLC